MPYSKASYDTRKDFGNLEANIRFLFQSGVIKKNEKILEIGCGTGSLLNYLLENGYDVQGVEKSKEFIRESTILYGYLPLFPVESEKLPFADNSFDLVISFDVFEHLPDSDGHLLEVARVLKPDGYYLLQTPNKYTNTIFETIRWKSFTKWRDDHCSLHSYREIVERLRRNRFEPEFYDIAVVNDFFRHKVYRYLGKPGLILLDIMNHDKLPISLRTGFYIKARKM